MSGRAGDAGGSPDSASRPAQNAAPHPPADWSGNSPGALPPGQIAAPHPPTDRPGNSPGALPPALTRAAGLARLFVAGVAPVLPEDGLAPGLRSVVLLAPDEPAFWPHFTASPEYGDGRPDALDRWSRRVIGRIACDLGAKALFPFGGPPWRPFPRWATRSGRARISPVGLLVHDIAGLFISYRGAIALRQEVIVPPAPDPCAGCAAPCLSACPAGAFSEGQYTVPACHAFLDRPDGAECRDGGCLVRRACPVGQDRRPAAQSAFHMKAFHPS